MIKKLLIIITGVFFITLVIFFQIYTFLVPKNGSAIAKDFTSYYFGARIIKEGKIKSLYDPGVQLYYQNKTLHIDSKSLLPFRGLPVLGIIYIPFSLFEYATAYKLLVTLLLASLGFSFFLIKREYKTVSAILIAAYFIEPILIRNLVQGQPSVLFLMILVTSLVLLKSSRYLIAGLVLSLLFLKIQFFPVALIFAVLVNNKKFSLGFLLGTLFLALLNTVVYGPSLFYDYIKFLIFTEKPIFGSHLFSTYTLKSFVEYVGTLFNVNSNQWFLVLNLGLFFCLMVFLFIKRKNIAGSLEDKLSFAIFSGLFFGIHIIAHDLIFILLPIVFLMKDNQLSRNKYLLPVILLALIPWFEYLDIHLILVSICLILYFAFFYGRRVSLI